MNDRDAALDRLRAVAALAVVMLHVAGYHWTDMSQLARWDAFNLYDSLVRWCVPVFVMLSGVLFLDPAREYPLRELWSRKIARLALVFLFWSLVYALYDLTAGGMTAKDFLRELVFGHYHMWYLFLAAGLYAMTPLLRPITASRDTARYFLLLAAVFASLVPALQLIPLLGRSGVVSTLTAFAGVTIVTGYTGYFVLGRYLYDHRPPRGVRIALYAAGLLSVVLTVWATRTASLAAGAPDERFYDRLLPTAVLASAAVFTLFLSLPRPKERGLPAAVRRSLSRCSFGIYLIHPLVLHLLDRFLGLSTLSFSGWLSVPALTALAFSLSWGITAALRRIPLLGRWIV